MKASLHAAGARLHHRHRPDDLFAAPAAKRLAGLHRRATCIAEHDFLPRQFVNGPSPQHALEHMTPKRRYANGAEEFRSKCFRSLDLTERALL